jgi:hypothetical protein
MKNKSRLTNDSGKYKGYLNFHNDKISTMLDDKKETDKEMMYYQKSYQIRDPKKNLEEDEHEAANYMTDFKKELELKQKSDLKVQAVHQVELDTNL